jgi:hypothetical protein
VTTPKPQNRASDALFELESEQIGIGSTQRRTIAALQAMNDDRPFTASQQLLAEVARALAENIDRGNMKGRSIGNEAMQLQSVIATLVGETNEHEDPLDLPAETLELMRALANSPQ